jgi:hypothetical protein
LRASWKQVLTLLAFTRTKVQILTQRSADNSELAIKIKTVEGSLEVSNTAAAAQQQLLTSGHMSS